MNTILHNKKFLISLLTSSNAKLLKLYMIQLLIKKIII